ncbi:VWA domain-containing protein [Deinococcus sp. KSM4-11]|uniref:vWA domain-containing protein n=1 Tax=Deinococcus sp. KSM4-11 TaxID=2568654 RepID=UPI0010A44F0C|nr:VWA domain-containing protein [Deinococcus sp. KSM4-11]THF85057.1 VWA domain-containing protein [Deinococcus sp. KSM4-11]
MTADPAPPLPADLATRVTAFVARLRTRHGFLLGPGEAADALRTLGVVDVLRKHEVRDALRAVLTASPEQRRVFDQEFNAFFRPDGGPLPPTLPPLLPQTEAPGVEQEHQPSPPNGADDAEPEKKPAPTPPDSGDGDDQGDVDTTQAQPLGESDDGSEDPDEPAQTIRTKLSPNASGGGEFDATEGDLPELLRAAGALVRAVELGRSRRLKPMPRGPKLDARRTIRAAARTAGDATLLKWLGRPRRAPRFLLILDGSRSMGRDATLLLRFAHALHLRSRRVEVYAFSTGLTRLTPLLRGAPPGKTLHLPDLGEAWGGGTRIGENLLKLARQEREHVNRDTLVFILSDGLDTGPVEELERAMRELHHRAARVVWLSPLAGMPGYQPVQRAVKAALPYLDGLLPASGVGDLHALAGRLKRGGALR